MKSSKLIAIPCISLFLFQVIFAGLQDRAFATHNVGQLGYFTTNIGQFYPYGGQFEKTLEYPINSGHVCMYRQCLMIGVPFNVISAADGRFEEFDAVGGFNAGNQEIAMSDNMNTWPYIIENSGQDTIPYWPVRDEDGNPIFRSEQDSYCVYSDSTNWRYSNNNEDEMLMDIRVHQSIWSWGLEDADKFVILQFEIENTGLVLLQDMYFNFYSDLDIGGMDNAAEEWADDCISFDKTREFVYFYDSDNYSNQWEETDPFLSGVIFLETPNGLGITDWHWIDVYTDEVAVNNTFYDSLSYNLMRSDTTWFHNNPDVQVQDFFHLGPDPLNGTHFDDPATTRIEDTEGNVVGGPMVAYISNGPFDVPAGEKQQILVAALVGDNEADLIHVADKIWEHYNSGFALFPVPGPAIELEAGDQQMHILWSNQLDVEYTSPVIPEPTNDLEGYIIYRTSDPLLSYWTALDTIPMLYKESTQIEERIYDYVDEDVYNGFMYYYDVAAYRYNPEGEIEETSRLGSIANIDNVSHAAAMEPTSQPAINSGDLNKIRVVPNPYVLSAPWDKDRIGNTIYGEPIRNVAFTNLPVPCTIRIFTVDGDLINTLKHEGGSGREEWNLLTSEQRPIVSGIYFFHVDSDLGEEVGRFAVIR